LPPLDLFQSPEEVDELVVDVEVEDEVVMDRSA
jgi:hypothetical protein